MKKAALLSVSDRTNLLPFAAALAERGYILLTTGGTGKYLQGEGLTILSIEEYTGQKEILDGRVKTLHPKIHAGLLAKRDKPEHMKELEGEGIYPIEVVAVNLYPFAEALKTHATDTKKMIEYIDIGGPTMIRAAAKNHASIFAVIDPTDYARVIEVLSQGGDASKLRQELAAKVFARQAAYDGMIAEYLAGLVDNQVTALVLEQAMPLRYGENPHQTAGFYVKKGQGELSWKKLQGKELSYNNLLDIDAALRLGATFRESKPFCAILKHNNPCGAAFGSNLEEALQKAKECDPRSHFGGIIVFNRGADLATAVAVREDFAEVIIAPSFDEDAKTEFAKSKNLRLIACSLETTAEPELRSAAGGYLLQEQDQKISLVRDAKLVAGKVPSAEIMADLELAWKLAAFVKSNAIAIVKDGMLVAAGAGQMSRIDSVELALSKASRHGHKLAGSVAASDAFFPFPDSVETLASAGITAIVVPSGAKRDDDIIAVASKLGISLFFTGDRHFRH